MDKRIIHSSALEWSDEEDDNHKYRTKIKTVDNNMDDDESLDSFQVNVITDNEQGSFVGMNTLADHRRSKFSGCVQVGNHKVVKLGVGPTRQKNIPVVKQFYPHVPSDVQHILGSTVLELIWKEFVAFGADETLLILVRNARLIPKKVSEIAAAPLSKVTFLDNRESSDYIDFNLFVIELSKVFNKAKRLMTSSESTALCHVCCSMHACQHRKALEYASYST